MSVCTVAENLAPPVTIPTALPRPTQFLFYEQIFYTQYLSAAQIKECQTVLVSVLFSFSVSYVDQTTLAGSHLATSDTHIRAVPSGISPRTFRSGGQFFSFFYLSYFFSHDFKWAKTKDMSAAIRIRITQLS